MWTEYKDYDEKLKDTYNQCLIGGIFFLLILSAFFAVGCYMLSLQLKADSYVATPATVVDCVMRMERENHGDYYTRIPVYYNIVEYEFDGKTYEVTCDTPASTYNPPNEEGTVIRIFVNPKNPKDVVFRNSTHVILIVACYTVSVIGFIAIAFVFRKAIRTKKLINESKKQKDNINGEVLY